jgi:hypothetical protein
LGLARRSTLICCLSTKISASSVARDRNRSITIPKISLHKSDIEKQHRPILDGPPADWIYDRDRTTSLCDELTEDFGGAFEATSIDGCRLFCRLAEIWPHGVLGLLQHYPPEADIPEEPDIPSDAGTIFIHRHQASFSDDGVSAKTQRRPARILRFVQD